MNLEYFIANRLVKSKKKTAKISSPIITIAVIAVAIGMIMMLVSVATGIGLQLKIREKISAFNGHVIISNYDNNESEVSLVPISLNQDFYPNFKSVTEVEHIQGVITKAGIIRTDKTFEGIVFKGVGNDFRWDAFEEFIIKGRLPKLDSTLNEEVILSEYLASRLQLKLNDKFNVYFMKDDGSSRPNLRVFKIVGIYSSGLQEFDASYVFGDIRHLQRINKWSKDEIGNFEVFVSDFDNIDQISNKIHQETPSTFDTKTVLDKYYNIFDWLKITDSNIYLIIGLMLLVATVNIAVALLVLILERTQMIGVLKAMGATNWSIRKIFLYQALHLILRGLFFGNVIGVGILFIQDKFKIITLNPESYYVRYAPVYINLDYILMLNLLTVVICFIVLLLPSYIITKISPVKAIRFE